MKIFAVSDMHGLLEGLDPKGVDLVLVAGDFAPMHGRNARDLDYEVCPMLQYGRRLLAIDRCD